MQIATSIRGLLAGVALMSSTASAQSATLAGAVLTDPGERPIAGAEISIRALGLSARSDSAGQFTIPRVARGQHVVTVRALGFAPIESRISFAGGQQVEFDFLLAPSAQRLDTVDVKAKEEEIPSRISMRFTGFEERRALGLGRFITQDVMEQAGGRKLTDVLLSRIPGISATVDRGRRRLMSNRRVLRERCMLRVLVNGVIQEGFITDELDPSHVAAVEFHTISTTPPQFNATGSSPCGTLLIWLRG